jgi:hypothetical protein
MHAPTETSKSQAELPVVSQPLVTFKVTQAVDLITIALLVARWFQQWFWPFGARAHQGFPSLASHVSAPAPVTWPELQQAQTIILPILFVVSEHVGAMSE